MNLDFGKIMEGFVHAQIDANKRGDFSPDAGIKYLNSVNTALEQNEAVKKHIED